MKKRLLLGLLAAPLILASCGGDKPAEESKEPTTSVGDQSTPEGGNSQGEQPGGESIPAADTSVAPELTRAEKVDALFAKMATGANSTFVNPSFRTLEYYGDDVGFLSLYTQDYLDYGAYNGGVVKIPNYGLFQYSYDENKDEVDAYQIYATNMALDISDLAYTTKDLGLAADTVTFAESARTHTFSTSDSDFCETLAYMAGYDEETVALYPTKKVDFKISDDGNSILDLNLSLSGAADKSNKDIKETNLKIEKVGKTISLGVNDFIANPPAFRAATAWSAVETNVFGQIYQGFGLPFPTGASWAVVENIDNQGRFVYYDYKCGDRTTPYKAQVELAGFTLNADESDPAQKFYVYDKTLSPKTDSANEVRETLVFAYLNDIQTLTLHPAGEFVIMAYAYEVEETLTATELNAILASKKSYSNNTKSVVPTLSLGTNGGIVYQDATEEMAANYPQYDQLYYGVIKIYYATEAEAEAAIQNLIAQFVAAGYEDDSLIGYYYYGVDMYVILEDGESGGMSYTCSVVGTIAYDSNGNYLGYIVIEIDHSGYASSSGGTSGGYDDDYWDDYYDDWF